MSHSQPSELHRADDPSGVPFPIFGSEFCQEQTLGPSIENNGNNISSIASRLWDQMDEEKKEGYRQKAIAAKALHVQSFPGYTYRPSPGNNGEHMDGLEKDEMERCHQLNNVLIDSMRGDEIIKVSKTLESITVTTRTKDTSKPQPYLCPSPPSPYPTHTEPNIPTINSNGMLSTSFPSSQDSLGHPTPPSLDHLRLFPSSNLEGEPSMPYNSLYSSFVNAPTPMDGYILDTDPGNHTDYSVASVPSMDIIEFPDIPRELQMFFSSDDNDVLPLSQGHGIAPTPLEIPSALIHAPHKPQINFASSYSDSTLSPHHETASSPPYSSSGVIISEPGELDESAFA